MPPRRSSTSSRPWCHGRKCLARDGSRIRRSSGGADCGSISPTTDRSAGKARAELSTLVGQLDALARHRAVLFVFEDAHWIDSTSLELLERVTEHVRRLPALMIVTYRAKFEPPWTGEFAGNLVEIEPAWPARKLDVDQTRGWGQGAAGRNARSRHRAYRRHPAVYRGTDKKLAGRRSPRAGGRSICSGRSGAGAGDSVEPAGSR